MNGPGPWFVAAYHGACAGCGGDIRPDDIIRGDGGYRYLCEDCAADGEGELSEC